MGFLTDRERYDQVIQLWTETTEKVTQAVFRNFEENYPFNPPLRHGPVRGPG